ncbi:hypothetical protein J2746_002354 [Methanolobus bombayensis]|nr:hypothetical protein [Methanolobus bombayensis]
MAGKLSSSQADDLRDEAEIIIQLIQNSEGDMPFCSIF